MRQTSQAGQATVMVLGLALVALAVTGLAADGTKAFLYRRTLQSSADAAVLAGASEIETQTYYASRGKIVVIDPDAARRTASRWLSFRDVGARAAVAADDGRVAVVLRGSVPTLFLRLVGIDEIPVAVEAASTPRVVR